MTKTVTDGNGTTHFFDVSPGTRTRSPRDKIGAAMLFIPLATKMVEQVPMLVYYHGHKGPDTIEGYVNSKKERDFRSKLAAKKVLLVEPQGGPFSQFGTLATPAGLATLIEQAMFIALTYGPPVRPMAPLGAPIPKPKSLILAGFSGGGDALRAVVIDSKADYINRLAEVWCFDCMYSGEGKAWSNWSIQTARGNQHLRVRVTEKGFGETTGKPRAQYEDMIQAGLPIDGDFDAPVKTDHETLPGMFIEKWL